MANDNSTFVALSKGSKLCVRNVHLAAFNYFRPGFCVLIGQSELSTSCPVPGLLINSPGYRLQQGNTDCGLFAIAYATEVAFGHDPANFIFDQSQMRDHLFKCLTSKTIERFPKKQREI